MNIILHFWLRPLFMGFFGIGYGPNSGQTTQAQLTGSLANFATSTGEGDITASSDFFKDILSGDPSKIAQVLGPQISAINAQSQQNKKTTAEFGNRGGGTNASMQSADDRTRGAYNTAVSSLLTSSADRLGSLGGSLLSTGLAGHEAAFGEATTIHDETLAKWNNLFGSIGQTMQSIGQFVPGWAGMALQAGGQIFQS